MAERVMDAHPVSADRFAALMTAFPLFQGFTCQGAQRLLGRGEIREYVADEMLFREGEPPTVVALVLTGKVQVFVERDHREMVLTEAGVGAILGELAVLCGIPRAASVRASEAATVIQWSAAAFRNLLLRYPLLAERIFKESLRTLVEKERSLIDSIAAARGEAKQSG